MTENETLSCPSCGYPSHAGHSPECQAQASMKTDTIVNEMNITAEGFDQKKANLYNDTENIQPNDMRETYQALDRLLEEKLEIDDDDGIQAIDNAKKMLSMLGSIKALQSKDEIIERLAKKSVFELEKASNVIDAAIHPRISEIMHQLSETVHALARLKFKENLRQQEKFERMDRKAADNNTGDTVDLPHNEIQEDERETELLQEISKFGGARIGTSLPKAYHPEGSAGFTEKIDNRRLENQFRQYGENNLMLELNRLKGDRDLDSRQALQNKNITEIVILSPIVEDVYEKTEVPKRNLEDVLKEISEQ